MLILYVPEAEPMANILFDLRGLDFCDEVVERDSYPDDAAH